MDRNTIAPVLAITLGDVAGIGPEVLVRAWATSRLTQVCRPFVIGDANVVETAVNRWQPALHVERLGLPLELPSDPTNIPCLDPGLTDVSGVQTGCVDAAAARAAFEYLGCAVELSAGGIIDGIVTLPVNKAGLKAAGLHYPGHTEFLAERTGVAEFGMMLYRRGLGVVHVTLHVRLAEVPGLLKTGSILEKIRLLDGMMRRLGVQQPRMAVAGLNPHAGDGGVFGDEEDRVIRPAVEQACAMELSVVGPLPADTLFVRASQGEFDGVVAMYHDQGHIALKLLGWREAVNITVGLPIVRTSVAHGTGYDIVGQGRADPASLLEATLVAARLCRSDHKRE